MSIVSAAPRWAETDVLKRLLELFSGKKRSPLWEETEDCLPGKSFERNAILLYGMPGVGISTIGTLISASTGMPFVDTDRLIESRTGQTIQRFVDTQGALRFIDMEESVICSHPYRGMVVATGGSAVLNERTTAYLKREGTLIYLQASFESIARRMRRVSTRGVADAPGRSLEQVYADRCGIYEGLADITIDTDSLDEIGIRDRVMWAWEERLIAEFNDFWNLMAQPV